MRGEDIQLCDSCGRYLHLPETETKPAEEKPETAPAATEAVQADTMAEEMEAMLGDKAVILRNGFNDYIAKPVNSGVLAFKIERLFSKLKIS